MLSEDRLIPFTASPPPPGPYLVFAPHPDDETFGIGGTLLLAAQGGRETHVVILTDGALGSAADASDLGVRREQEAGNAAELLGLTSVEFWRLPDRGLKPTPALVDKVAATLLRRRPASLFFPSPMELHPDHRAAASLVWEGLRESRLGNTAAFGYEIGSQALPSNYLVDITAVAERKAEAMAAYPSQLAENDYVRKVLSLNQYRTYTLPPEVKYAEALYAYGRGAEGELAARTVSGLRAYWSTEPASYHPRVSVIVRTRDRPRLLREALTSVAAQTFPNIEVVVVNDGGDDVGGLVDEYRDAVSRIRYLSLEANRGRAGAANAGLDAASGKYLCFLDDDDLLLPEHIAGLVSVLETRAGVRAAYAGVRSDRDDSLVFNAPFDRLRLLIGNYIPIHAMMFERSLVRAGCRFDARFPIYEDWDFWLQLSRLTDFHHLDQVSALYRQGEDTGIENESVRLSGGERIFNKWKILFDGRTLHQVVDYKEREVRRYAEGLARAKAEAAELRGQARRLHEDKRRLSADVERLKADSTGQRAAAERDMTDLLERHRQREGEVQRLGARLEELDARVLLERERNAQLKAEVRKRDELLAQSNMLRRRGEQRIGAFTADIERIVAERRGLRRTIEEIRASHSWRFTRPLRWLSNLLRGRRPL